jgi:phospholipid/cholesterol/gamma-HCH transport system substrate-binding protein
MSRGLGSSYIELKQYPERPAEPLDPNQPETKYLVDKILLQGSTGITSEFFPEESQEKLEDLVEGLRILVANANDILGNRSNKENLQKTIANLTEASREAKQTIEEFRKLAVAGTSTLTNIDTKTQELIVAMVETSEEIGKASAQMRQILEKINNGKGSAARLINDGRFYENLLEDTQQIQLLLEELKSFITQARNKGVPIKLK